uniref:VWFA domain-containing protein n=1 Tax=Rhabditophanes sp. KR3021 TaxID=114890 RepID=A0AC35TV13_9BILA
MRLLYSFLLLSGFVGQASATCKCSTFLKPNLISQYDYSVLHYPRDNVTAMPCNPVKCIYTLGINELHGITGNIYYVRNFEKSKATLKFYNGNDLSTTPYFELDQNTKNSDLIVTRPSYDQFITIVLDVNNTVAKDFPTFIYYATGGKQGTTTTTTTTLSPIIVDTPVGSDSVAVVPPNVKFEGDIALLLDINSRNFTKLTEIAQDLINSVIITPFVDSQDARINVMLYNNGNVLPYGWNLDKTVLNLVVANLPRTLENNPNITSIISLGQFLSTQFLESKLTRQNVQRVALFVSDNEILQFDSNNTTSTVNYFDQNDIHPVFVNFNDNLSAKEAYDLANIKFSGSGSNSLVLQSFTNTYNLLNSILLNGNVLCNANGLISSSQNSISIPAVDQEKRYCNNMNVVTYCDIIDLAKPIGISIKQLDVEPQQDSVKVFDDKDSLQEFLSGRKINNLNLSVSKSVFVKVVFTTNQDKIFNGAKFTFDNCIIRA